jgi:hypothetical protein
MSKCAEPLLALLLVACSSAGRVAAGGSGGPAGDGGTSGSGTGGARGDAAAPPDLAWTIDLAPDAPDAQFCAGYAVKFCERLAGCSQTYLVGVYGTPARCQERLELRCRAEVAAAGTGLSAVTGMACADALAGASCDALFGDSVPACQIAGTLARGASCGSGSQCQSGFCRTPETSFCGKCDARVGEGAVCDADDACEFPLLCSEAGHCARPAAEGELCNETTPCQPGPLFCGSDNTCHRPSAEGKACNRTGSAPLQPCEGGFICRPSANGICRPIRFVDAGVACGISPTGSSVVLCTASGSCVNDLCKPPGQDGERCTPSPLGDSGGCLAPALCLDGLCKLPDPASCH